MSNLTELKRVVSALGGTPAESDTNDESIGKIADALENGSGGGGVVVVHEDSESGALDKTWQEIKNAAPSVVMMDEKTKDTTLETEILPLCRIVEKGDWVPPEMGVYEVVFSYGTEEYTYACSTADGYPEYRDEGGDTNV